MVENYNHASQPQHSSYKHAEETMVGGGSSPLLHYPAYDWIQYRWTSLYAQGMVLKS